MASSKALKLENRFAREEVEWDQQFDVLNEGLQPDTQTPIESVVSKISELLPEGGHYSGTYLFFMVCFEVADQIPYNHPSMKKLAQIINLVLNSERLQTESSRENPRHRYFKLSQASRDQYSDYNPSEDPTKYVRWHTLQAEMEARDMTRGAAFTSWTFTDAFENRVSSRELNDQGREACVFAASLYIVICGEHVFSEVPTDMLGRRCSDDTARKSTESSCFKDFKDFLRDVFGARRELKPFVPRSPVFISLEQWHRWAGDLKAVSRGERDTEKFSFGDECKDLAGRAGDAMFALESGKVGVLDE